MKVLLSAYACEPDKGSEPAVGWNWAIENARLGHEVWVLTRSNNKQSIEAEVSISRIHLPLHFVYYDLPRWARRLKRINGGIYPYYLAWQWGAYKVAKELIKDKKFNVVHHVTFVSVRQPSFMGKLGIPFIFGPVAGGEKAPWRLRFHFGVRGILIDALRDFLNSILKADPLLHQTLKQARQIYVTSLQTKNLLSSQFHHKTKIHLAIGLLNSNKIPKLEKNESKLGSKILFVGRFIHWKGMGLGLRSFAQLAKTNSNTTLTMVGKGPDEQRWRKLANKLNIADRITWVHWVEKSKMPNIYKNHDIFLFPSLHDSGGMVVLEAMSHGLPVVCFNLGGPNVMVNDSCGIKTQTSGKTEGQIVEDIYIALHRLTNDNNLLKKLSIGAYRRAASFEWENCIANFYNI